MALFNQGFVRAFNLEELENEALAINNLAGGSISDDLELFAGNTINKSKLIYKFNEPGYTIETNNRFRFDLFSLYGNGDKVLIKGARSIDGDNPTAVSYDDTTNTLTITTEQLHGFTQADIDAKVEVELREVYFSIATTQFNTKYRLFQIISTNTFKLGPILDPLDIDNFVLSGGSGNFEGYEANGVVYYPHIVSDAFDLPDPLVKDVEYFIVSSNAVDNFQLAVDFQRGFNPTPVTLSELPTTPLIFERGEVLTKDSLFNLIRPRTVERDGQNGGIDPIYNNGVLFNDLDENFDILESRIDSANFFRLKKYVTTLNNNYTTDPIKLEGNLRSIDPDSFNAETDDLFDSQSPGVYILDPGSDIDNPVRLRAFSDNTQPWEFDGTDTLEYAVLNTAADQKISIGNLALKGTTTKPTIALNNIQGVTLATGGATTANKFTHKLPVLIDGFEYNILLTDSTADP